MGKTRDVFKKIRDTKGTFHAKMSTINNRNGTDLTEPEDIKMRWQEYSELYKKDLHDPDNYNGVITHLEPDILECKVRWALGSITTNKASGGDGIPAELFQILKDELLKCCTYCASKSGKLSSGHRTKVSFHSNPKERQCQRVLKLAHNCTHLQQTVCQQTNAQNSLTRLQQCVNHELPDVQTGLIKGRGTRDQIINICWIIKKARGFHKDIYFCFIDYAKALDCVDQTNWKILKDMGIPDHLTCLLRNLNAGQEATVRTGHGPTDWFQIGKKEYAKAAFCHPAYLTYMQSTS